MRPPQHLTSLTIAGDEALGSQGVHELSHVLRMLPSLCGGCSHVVCRQTRPFGVVHQCGALWLLCNSVVVGQVGGQEGNASEIVIKASTILDVACVAWGPSLDFAVISGTLATKQYKCLCVVTELNLPHTNGGAVFDGCASSLDPDLAAVVGRLTRLDLSRGSGPMAAADAVALIGACTCLRWLGAPAVRQLGAALPSPTWSQ